MRSRRSLRVCVLWCAADWTDAASGPGIVTASKISSAHCSSPSCDPGGVRFEIVACAAARRSSARPSPDRALQATTRQPRRSCNLSMSTTSPRRRKRSIMLRATTVGRRRRRASPTSSRLRPRFVASDDKAHYHQAPACSRPGRASVPARTRPADLGFVLVKLKRVDARQVDELQTSRLAIGARHMTDACFLRRAREVAGLVAQAREPVEKRRLASIRVAQEGDADCGARWSLRLLAGGREVTLCDAVHQPICPTMTRSARGLASPMRHAHPPGRPHESVPLNTSTMHGSPSRQIRIRADGRSPMARSSAASPASRLVVNTVAIWPA